MAIPVKTMTSDECIRVCTLARGNFDARGMLTGIDESQGCALLDAGLAHVVYWGGEGGMPGMIEIHEDHPHAIAQVLSTH